MKTLNNFYTDGEYLKNNPTWDSEDAPWKAKQLFDLLNKNISKIESKKMYDEMSEILKTEKAEEFTFKKISEVGCGSGEVLINFANLINKNENKNIKYVGYDLSPDAINIANKNKQELFKTKKKKIDESQVLDNFEFKVMSVPDQKSDILICADVFEHIEDPFTFLRDIKKTSDYFLFNIPLDLSVQSIIRDYTIVAQRKRVGHVNYYTKSLAVETLKDTGYEVIDISYGKWYKIHMHGGIITKISNIFRDLLMPICPDICVKWLGGSSLIVLAK